MGNSASVPAAQPMGDVLQAYQQYLPGVLQATSAETPNVAMNQLNSTLMTQPMYDALNLQQTQQYALPLAQVGQDVTRSNALSGAETNLMQMLGPGGAAGVSALPIAQAANPYYYNVMGPASQQASNLLGSINLNGLSPGEANATERSLNQNLYGTGNLGNLNPMDTVSNAINFGGAFNSKLGILGNALGAANQTANTAQNTGFNPVSIALGQPNTSTMANFGTNTFSPSTASTNAGSMSGTLGFGSGLLGNMSSMNNAATSAQGQLGAANIQANSPSSYLGAICCFIFLEAYHGALPSFIRKSRDKYYEKHPSIASGYRRMAYYLVPAMQHIPFIRWFVWTFMVKPITQYLGYTNRQLGYKKCSPIITHFWLRVWAILGKQHEPEYYEVQWKGFFYGLR